MKKILKFLLFTLALTSLAFAQNFPKAEVSAGYSYMNQSFSVPFSASASNGIDGSFTYNLSPMFGIKAGVSDYFAGSSKVLSGNQFIFAVGPVVKYRASKFQPFGEALIGVAHDSYSGFANGGQSAFATVLGGGLDIVLSKSFTLRAAEVDYVLTNYAGVNDKGFYFNSSQNNVKIGTGLVFTF